MSELTIDDRQQVIADLQAARSELVTRGWCKDELQNATDGTVCALGAVHIAVNGHAELHFGDLGFDRCIEAQKVLSLCLGNDLAGGFDIAGFNDAAETGYQDVLNLFDKALAELGGLA